MAMLALKSGSESHFLERFRLVVRGGAIVGCCGGASERASERPRIERLALDEVDADTQRTSRTTLNMV